MEGKKLFLDGAQVSETKRNYIFSDVTDKGNSEKVDFFSWAINEKQGFRLWYALILLNKKSRIYE